MKRWIATIVSLFALCSVFALAAPTASAAVDVFNKNCSGEYTDANGVVQVDPKAAEAAKASGSCGVSTADPITGADGTLAKVTRLIAYMAGIASFILIIIGGIMYINSGGDPSKVGAARNTVLYAVIGLVVIILAQGIIVFLLNKIAK